MKIGQNRISSFDTDESQQGQMCRYVYDQSRQTLLALYPWTFASRFSELAKVPPDPAFPNIEYANRFSLPAEFLRLIAVYDGRNREPFPYPNAKPPWDMISGHILADFDTCKVKYVFDLEQVPDMAPLFVDCMVVDIALRMTKIFNDSGTYLQQLQQERELLLRSAKIEDCRQLPSKQIRSSPLLEETGMF
jgi:hypothetical protein